MGTHKVVGTPSGVSITRAPLALLSLGGVIGLTASPDTDASDADEFLGLGVGTSRDRSNVDCVMR
jgi:hypothetical protein